MNTSGEDQEISPDELSATLDDSLPQLDLMRAVGLEGLQLMRTARAEGLRSEQERLTTEKGADHRRVVELGVRLADNEEFISGLAVEKERAGVAAPEADEQTWVLHGFIRDQQLRGVSNVTVALYDETGNWAQRLGYAPTSPNGYFRLNARNLSNVKATLFVHVLNNQAAHLYADNFPLTPEAGSVLYHEVVIDTAQSATPPGESRNDPVVEPGAWIVRGRVSDNQGKGLSNLVVSLYDKDLFFDDRLGQTETNNNGDYSLTYRTEDFRDLIERKPDIYIKVLDAKGKTLYTSKKKLRYEAGRVEILNIEIEDPIKK